MSIQEIKRTNVGDRMVITQKIIEKGRRYFETVSTTDSGAFLVREEYDYFREAMEGHQRWVYSQKIKNQEYCRYHRTPSMARHTLLVDDQKKVGTVEIRVNGTHLDYAFTHHGGAVVKGKERIYYCPRCGKQLEEDE